MPTTTTTTQTITIQQTSEGYRADDLRFHRLAGAISYVERMGAEPAFDLPATIETTRELWRMGFNPITLTKNGAR